MPKVNVGTQWICVRGRHAGVEVEVVKLTEGDRVVFKHVGGEGKNWNKTKSDSAGLETLGTAYFASVYQPKDSLASSNGHGGKAYRHRYTPPEQTSLLEEEVPPPPSAELLDHYVSQGDAHLSISVQLVTPDMAKAWLERGGANRKLVERRVARLARAIREGEWQLTGDSIKLDGNGLVRDGQHRLAAIARAGLPVQAVVVRNVTEKAFDVIDTGRARAAADVLSIHGHTNTTALATVARGLILLERFGRYATNQRDNTYGPPSNTQIVEYVEAHPELHEAVNLADLLRTSVHFIGGTGLWAIGITMFLRVNPEQARVFVRSLIE